MGGLQIERPSAPSPIGVIADRRLYVTADRTALVPEGSLEAAFLLALPGDVVPAELAAALGLTTAPAPMEEALADLATDSTPPVKGKAPRAAHARHAADG